MTEVGRYNQYSHSHGRPVQSVDMVDEMWYLLLPRPPPAHLFGQQEDIFFFIIKFFLFRFSNRRAQNIVTPCSDSASKKAIQGQRNIENYYLTKTL